MTIHPYVGNEYGLCVESDSARSALSIGPGEEVIIPMLCSYKVTTPGGYINKTISFDIRTSLYQDPVNYTFTVTAKNTATVQDKVLIANRRQIKLSGVSKVLSSFVKPIRYFTTAK